MAGDVLRRDQPARHGRVRHAEGHLLPQAARRVQRILPRLRPGTHAWDYCYRSGSFNGMSLTLGDSYAILNHRRPPFFLQSLEWNVYLGDSHSIAQQAGAVKVLKSCPQRN